MRANFQEKRTTLTFSTQICPKMNFGVRISKIKVRIRNLHFQHTMCVNFQLKRTTFTFLAQICPKRKLGFEICKTNVEIRISILEIHEYQFSDKTDNLEFLGPNLPKSGFWGQNFKNLSLDSESASLRYYVHQFSDKTNNFEFFGLNLGKLPNYVQYFGSNIVESVAESWLEAEMSWVELGGAGCTV